MINAAVRRTPSIRFVGKRPPVKFDPNSRRNAWAGVEPSQQHQPVRNVTKSTPTQLPPTYQRRPISELEIQYIMVCTTSYPYVDTSSQEVLSDINKVNYPFIRFFARRGN
jgi:hypothetical protein